MYNIIDSLKFLKIPRIEKIVTIGNLNILFTTHWDLSILEVYGFTNSQKYKTELYKYYFDKDDDYNAQEQAKIEKDLEFYK